MAFSIPVGFHMAEISPDLSRLPKEKQDSKKNTAADKAGADLASEASKPGSTHSLDTAKISEQAGSSSKSVTLPHLEIQGDLKQSPDLIKSLSRKALKDGLTSEEYAALAKALAQTKDESVAKALRAIFKETFLHEKTKDVGTKPTKAETSAQERHQVKQVSEALTGLCEALNSTDIPQENLKQLATLYSLGADSPLNKFMPDPKNRLGGDIGGDFKRQCDQLFSKAATGSVNQSDLQILVALAHGTGQSNSNANPFVRDKDDKYVPGDSLAKQARDLLTHLALNPENRSKILALLTDEKLNQLLPDKSHGLETLGLIAAQDPTNLITSDLRKQLQEGLLSDGSRKSAQAGMLAIAQYLNDSDMATLAKHIIPGDLRGAVRTMDSISSKRLVNELAAILVNPEKMEVKENAALALKELALCATPTSVAALTSLRGKEAQEKLKQREEDILIGKMGVSLSDQPEHQAKLKQQVEKLQDSTGDALLEIARTSLDKDTKNKAFGAFAEHNYHNKDHQFAKHVQEVLERNPKSVSMHRLALKLEVELPSSTSDAVRIATIFGNYDPKVSDGFLTVLTQNAINNYGKEKVVTIAQRLALYNSLTPALRKELLGTDAKQFDDQSLGQIEPSVVLGQLSNKTFGSPSSPSYFLSQDLESKVAALRTHEQKQVQAGMKELIALAKLKDASLKNLGNHSADGIGLYSKLLSSANLSDAEHKFIQSQQTQLTNIKDIDLALKAKEKSVQEAASKDNLLAVAQGNEKFVSLVKEGKIKQADQLALDLLTKHGRDVLTSAQSLSYVVTVSKEEAHVSSPALTHLQEQGKTQFAQLPLLLPGETKKSLEVLASIKPNRAYDPATGEFKEQSFADSEIVRNEALRAIDHDPALLNTRKLAQSISQHSATLTTQLEAAERGGAKFYSYIQDARKHGEAIKTALDDVSPKDLEQLRNLKTQIQATLDQPGKIEDQQARLALTNRANSIDNLLAILDKDYKLPAELVKHKGVLEADLANLDKKLYNGEWKDSFPKPGEPGYKSGMTEEDLHNLYLDKRHEMLAQLRGINAGTARAQIDKMLVDLSKPEFGQESTFKTWFKKDGVELLGSAAGVAGAIALEVATFGEATPLLAALVATGGGMIGSEITREGQYYAGLLNQGSLGGNWHRGESTLQEDGSLKSLNLFDVSSSYGSQLLVGTARNLVASGIGGKLGEVLGKMSGQARAAFMAENQETITALAKTSAKLEALAAKDSNFATLLQRELISQLRFTGSTEAIEKTDLFEKAKKSLGEAEGLSSFLLNVGLSAAHSGYHSYGIGKITYRANRSAENKSMQPASSETSGINKSPTNPIAQYAITLPDYLEVQIAHGVKDTAVAEAQKQGAQVIPESELNVGAPHEATGNRKAYGDNNGTVYLLDPQGKLIKIVPTEIRSDANYQNLSGLGGRGNPESGVLAGIGSDNQNPPAAMGARKPPPAESTAKNDLSQTEIGTPIKPFKSNSQEKNNEKPTLLPANEVPDLKIVGELKIPSQRNTAEEGLLKGIGTEGANSNTSPHSKGDRAKDASPSTTPPDWMFKTYNLNNDVAQTLWASIKDQPEQVQQVICKTAQAQKLTEHEIAELNKNHHGSPPWPAIATVWQHENGNNIQLALAAILAASSQYNELYADARAAICKAVSQHQAELAKDPSLLPASLNVWEYKSGKNIPPKVAAALAASPQYEQLHRGGPASICSAASSQNFTVSDVENLNKLPSEQWQNLAAVWKDSTGKDIQPTIAAALAALPQYNKLDEDVQQVICKAVSQHQAELAKDLSLLPDSLNVWQHYNGEHIQPEIAAALGSLPQYKQSQRGKQVVICYMASKHQAELAKDLSLLPACFVWQHRNEKDIPPKVAAALAASSQYNTFSKNVQQAIYKAISQHQIELAQNLSLLPTCLNVWQHENGKDIQPEVAAALAASPQYKQLKEEEQVSVCSAASSQKFTVPNVENLNKLHSEQWQNLVTVWKVSTGKDIQPTVAAALAALPQYNTFSKSVQQTICKAVSEHQAELAKDLSVLPTSLDVWQHYEGRGLQPKVASALGSLPEYSQLDSAYTKQVFCRAVSCHQAELAANLSLLPTCLNVWQHENGKYIQPEVAAALAALPQYKQLKEEEQVSVCRVALTQQLTTIDIENLNKLHSGQWQNLMAVWQHENGEYIQPKVAAALAALPQYIKLDEKAQEEICKATSQHQVELAKDLSLLPACFVWQHKSGKDIQPKVAATLAASPEYIKLDKKAQEATCEATSQHQVELAKDLSLLPACFVWQHKSGKDIQPKVAATLAASPEYIKLDKKAQEATCEATSQHQVELAKDLSLLPACFVWQHKNGKDIQPKVAAALAAMGSYSNSNSELQSAACRFVSNNQNYFTPGNIHKWGEYNISGWQYIPNLPPKVLHNFLELPAKQKLAVLLSWTTTEQPLHEQNNYAEFIDSFDLTGRNTKSRDVKHILDRASNTKLPDASIRKSIVGSPEQAFREIFKKYDNLDAKSLNEEFAKNGSDSLYFLLESMYGKRQSREAISLNGQQLDALHQILLAALRHGSDVDVDKTPELRQQYYNTMLKFQVAEYKKAIEQGGVTPESAIRLVGTFGKTWSKWLERCEKLNIDQHDASYWLPLQSAKEINGLPEWLNQNLPRQITDQQNLISGLSIASRNWSKLSADEKNLPRDQLVRLIRSRTYPNAQNKDFAAEAAYWGIGEYNYDKYEKRFLESQKVSSPFKEWESVEWQSGSLGGRFLPRSDVRGLFLGHHTNCCQHPDHQGATSAWHGQESKQGGFFVVENKAKEIVAMSWAWINDDGMLCFDNVEAKGLGANQSKVQTIYKNAAQALLKDFPLVTLGTGHSDLDLTGLASAGEKALKPSTSYSGYTDAKKQVLLAESSSHNTQPAKKEPVTVRGGLSSDHERCLEIAKACYPDGWQHIEVEFDHAMVLEVEGKGVVGYATIETDKKYISDIAIDPNHRQHDLSLKFLNSLSDYMKKHGDTWEADCRESTSYKLLKLSERRQQIEILSEQQTGTMGNDKMYRVKFKFLGTH